MSEREKFYRLAVEAGRIGTWDLNLQTEECLISPEMAELMGFSSDQTTVPGAQWQESIVPEDRTLMSSALAPSIASDAPFDLEFRIALKDGTQRWLYSRGAVSRDASGKALRMYGASIDVTERKQADEKLRESEERLRRAIEIETVGVIFFKTDGSITNANDAFLRMSGYSREDLAEGLVRWDEMTPPEWMPHSLKAIEEFESTGRTIPYEKEFVRKDGSRWWALFAATRLDEEEGVEFIIDITQSKRAEVELRKSGERITNILESITDAFVAVDRQWRFTYINERALTTLQRTREELLGKNMWEEFPEAVGLPTYREYHRAMTSGNSVHFEEFNPWLDIWVEINAYPSEGGLAIYFRDITERKRAEEERARLASIVESSDEAIISKTLDGIITSWNKGAERIYGYSADETVGQPISMLVPPDRPDEIPSILESLRRGEKIDHFETVRVTKDGRRLDISLTVSPIRNSSGDIVGASTIARDITERKRVEEERDRLRAREIEARSQREERRRIARDLHDVVLQDLAGTLQSLRLIHLRARGSGLELDLEEELEALGRATLGLRNAVHDLRGENERPFVQSVESLVELNRRLAPDCNIGLVVKEGFPNGLPREVGGELLRVIREALTNARHHSGAKSVAVTLKVEGSDLVAEISDDGQGFALEGTPGVGLSSMQERAAIVEGRLEIESEVGQGTSVRLRVPVPQTE